jgi:hypothetical protein
VRAIIGNIPPPVRIPITQAESHPKPGIPAGEGAVPMQSADPMSMILAPATP